ncbi:MAG: hypothetical protein JNJ39_07270 [Blastocatellia bacterium]|nr:hypothetical protein [Blastocatellia bacterium]
MSIVDKVKKESEKFRKENGENTEFRDLESFYAEMKRLGIAKTAQYELPPTDTLGKRFYDIQHATDKKRFI